MLLSRCPVATWLQDITDIGDVSAQCAAQCLEALPLQPSFRVCDLWLRQVEAPKPYDQEQPTWRGFRKGCLRLPQLRSCGSLGSISYVFNTV